MSSHTGEKKERVIVRKIIIRKKKHSKPVKPVQIEESPDNVDTQLDETLQHVEPPCPSTVIDLDKESPEDPNLYSDRRVDTPTSPILSAAPVTPAQVLEVATPQRIKQHTWEQEDWGCGSWTSWAKSWWDNYNYDWYDYNYGDHNSWGYSDWDGGHWSNHTKHSRENGSTISGTPSSQCTYSSARSLSSEGLAQVLNRPSTLDQQTFEQRMTEAASEPVEGGNNTSTGPDPPKPTEPAEQPSTKQAGNAVEEKRVTEPELGETEAVEETEEDKRKREEIQKKKAAAHARYMRYWRAVRSHVLSHLMSSILAYDTVAFEMCLESTHAQICISCFRA